MDLPVPLAGKLVAITACDESDGQRAVVFCGGLIG
jgi:hypothetical protein